MSLPYRETLYRYYGYKKERHDADNWSFFRGGGGGNTKPLNDLEIGTLIKDSNTQYYGKPIIWRMVDRNHEGYPKNSITLITEKILCLKCIDGAEGDNPNENIKTQGNSYYPDSNIRKWLNSRGGDWYVAQHEYDTPPILGNTWYNTYRTETGFLTNFSNDFYHKLMDTTHPFTNRESAVASCTDKIFLASATEMGTNHLGQVFKPVAGFQLSGFPSTNRSIRIAYPTEDCVNKSDYKDSTLSSTQPWNYWCSDCQNTGPAISYFMNLVVTADGSVGANTTYEGRSGIRPLCNVPNDISVYDTPDEDGVYQIIWT